MKSFEIQGTFPWQKPKPLVIRDDGFLYNEVFIGLNECQTVNYYTTATSCPEAFSTKWFTSCNYYCIITGGNKKIHIGFGGNRKSNASEQLYLQIKDTLFRTAGVEILKNIIPSVNNGVDHTIGRVTFRRNDMLCYDSALFIEGQVNVPQFSIKGKSVNVPYSRAACSYVNGVIVISDTLHKKLNCRINPSFVPNSVLIPHMIAYFSSH